MEQSNLLKLAKQGEPSAIAALMNAVLEPRGITARASFEAEVLCVFLESPKPLNQETLVTFIRKGLLELENDSIQRVRAQGRRIGEKTFAWSKEFFVRPVAPPIVQPKEEVKLDPVVETAISAERNTEETAVEEPPIQAEGIVTQAIQATDAVDSIEVPASQLETEASESLGTVDLSLNDSALETPESIGTIDLSVDDPLLEISESTGEIDLSLDDPLLETSKPTGEIDLSVDEPEFNNNLRVVADDGTLEDEESEEDPLEPQSLRAWLKLYWRAYSLPVLLVIVGGFIAGGAMAFWSTSKPQNQDAVEDLLQPREQSLASKQEEAEKYLKAMNKAQAEFFEKNKRFANTLEELERSANLIAQSYSYAYRLRVSDPEKEAQSQRSLITASPREADLKSYVGAVFILPSGAESIVCQTPKSSMEAPDPPRVIRKQLSCAPRSTKVQ